MTVNTVLTAGYVSGFIAIVIAILQIALPNLIILILVHLLGYEQSAATWSIAGKELQTSSWPTLLRTDAAADRGVKRNIKLLSVLRQSTLIIVAIAAFVTPLGLHDIVTLENATTKIDFAYVKDTSVLGKATLPRDPWMHFGRPEYPGTPDVTTVKLVPDDLIDLFESGLNKLSSTVSSIFDIQWRRFDTAAYGTQGGKWNTIGEFSVWNTYLPADDIKLFEGLIVDYTTGGVGLRNHTIPKESNFDAEWEEDILFIVPETSCVDTNLTLKYLPRMKNATGETLVNWGAITDRGGFVNLPHSEPPKYASDARVTPDLQLRATRGAWVNNLASMVFLNVTTPFPQPWKYLNSTLNKRFFVPGAGPTGGGTWQQISTGDYYMTYLKASKKDRQATLDLPHDFSNPFNLPLHGSSTAMTACQGSSSSDADNLSNVAISCYLFGGTFHGPDQQHGVHQPLYSCASTTKAVIKTVKFHHHSSQGAKLESLEVLHIRDKVYQKQSDMPTWGVEKFTFEENKVGSRDIHGKVNQKRSPRGYLAVASSKVPERHFAPLWGLVANDTAKRFRNNVTLIQSDRLYLPGYPNGLLEGVGSNGIEVPADFNLPGSDFYLRSLWQLGRINFNTTYSGGVSRAMSEEWVHSSKSPEDTAKMLNLVWTDLSANVICGSRGWLSKPRNYSDLRVGDLLENRHTASVPVYLYVKHLVYHWLFSIPALLSAAILIVVALVACGFSVFGDSRPSRIRYLLSRTNVGRLMALDTQEDLDLRTGEWVAMKGQQRVDLRQLGRVEYKSEKEEEWSKETLRPTMSDNSKSAAPALHRSGTGDISVVW